MKDKQDRRMTEFLRYNSVVVAHFLVPSSSIAKAALQVAPLLGAGGTRGARYEYQACRGRAACLTRSSTLEQGKDVRSMKVHGYSAFTNHVLIVIPRDIYFIILYLYLDSTSCLQCLGGFF